MKSVHIIIVFFLLNSIFAQTSQFETGELIDRVVVNDKPNESFALYLPKSFNPTMLSAIVFVFDPSGNGANGLKPFIDSAEYYNYILVCSNNSKNGPYEFNFDITNRLFAHIFSEFNIDEKQIYTAGFSGGSRLASTVAVLTGAIQGVIACGAGFANEFQNKPSAESRFSYIGLVGDEDMNYQEMFNAKAWLDRFKVNNALFTYDDGHRWPPSEQLKRAFGWIELQAYKRKLRPVNKELLNNLYTKNLRLADSLKQEQAYRAVMEYDRIIEDFQSYFEVDSVQNKRDQLMSSKAFKNEAKIRQEIADKEFKWSEKLLDRFRKESAAGEPIESFSWWTKELTALDKYIEKNKTIYTEKMNKRLRYRLMAVSFESSMVYANSKNLKKVLYCDKLLTHLYPERPYWHYKLAETYAKLNDAKNTQKSLQTAIEKGFDDSARITSNPLFVKFKNKNKFAAFLETLQ